MDEQDYLDFLMEVFKASAKSNGDPKVVYPLLQANLDKLDDNFIDFLQTSAIAKLSKVGTDVAKLIAYPIWCFSYSLHEFPLGNKANNMEIVIAGCEVALKVFTRESDREIWVAIQNNLGIA